MLGQTVPSSITYATATLWNNRPKDTAIPALEVSGFEHNPVCGGLVMRLQEPVSQLCIVQRHVTYPYPPGSPGVWAHELPLTPDTVRPCPFQLAQCQREAVLRALLAGRVSSERECTTPGR